MGENKNGGTGSSIRGQLETNYHNAKSSYYRLVLRKQDDLVRHRLHKIPDNWDEYNKNRLDSEVEISSEKQTRLSDLKKKKSWELKFESLNIYFISSIENAFLDTLKHKFVTEEFIDDAVDSVKSITLEIGGNISNFKLLLLSLAKRGVSDLYYIIMSYDKFNNINLTTFDEHFENFCRSQVKSLRGYQNILRNIHIFQNASRFIENFFQKSSSSRGWKINEAEIKAFLEDENPEISIIDLRKIIIAADQYRKRLKKDFEFLNYYYNDKDGKMFRYDFIVDSLKLKFNNGKINDSVFEGFESVRNSFIAIKKYYENTGLAGFGSNEFTYNELVEFILKTGKIIEFYFLRSSRYEELKNLRNDILYYNQEEYYQLNPEADRF